MASYIERTSVGKPRDLKMEFAYADQKKCPFTSQLRKGPAMNLVKPEWPVDNYLSVSTDGVVEDTDVSSGSYTNMFSGSAMLETYIQIWRRVPSVSNLRELTTSAGIPAKQAYAKSVAKALVMLKRDMEATFLSDNESAADDGSTQAYKTRGLGKWIQSTAQSVQAVAAAYRTPATSIVTDEISTINDDTIEEIMASIYDQTGEEGAEITVWCGLSVKRQISKLAVYDTTDSDLTTVREFDVDAASKTITRAIDVIETDVGTAKLRLSGFINSSGDPTSAASKRLAYFVPDDQCEARFLKAPGVQELPNLGGGRRGMVEAIGCLTVKNPLCLGKIAAAADSTT